MAKTLFKWFQVVSLSSLLMLAMSGFAADADTDASKVDQQTKRPGYGAVMADALILRPLGVIALVAGSVVFVVTIPFSAPTGTIGEAGHTLVVDPALATFARCLGCTESGWRKFPAKQPGDE